MAPRTREAPVRSGRVAEGAEGRAAEMVGVYMKGWNDVLFTAFTPTYRYKQ